MCWLANRRTRALVMTALAYLEVLLEFVFFVRLNDLTTAYKTDAGWIDFQLSADQNTTIPIVFKVSIPRNKGSQVYNQKRMNAGKCR